MKLRFLCLAAVLVAGCTGNDGPNRTLRSPEPTVTLINTDGEPVKVAVEVARGSEALQKGLMGRTALADGEGMLFVFEQERPLSFWMKNTLIPLDILFFNRQGNIVSSTTMQPCTADPCRTYPSAGPALYALEVPGGYLKRLAIDPKTPLKIHGVTGLPTAQ